MKILPRLILMTRGPPGGARAEPETETLSAKAEAYPATFCIDSRICVPAVPPAEKEGAGQSVNSYYL